ncbi:MAG: DUF2490 domain-containing protein [Gammaproteobacteria bacterium]|nr:DUF2490 domain-containing protein [Gammaproteobacteria bacterium]
MPVSHPKHIFILILVLLTQTSPAWSLVSTNKFWVPLTLNGNYGKFLYFVEPQPRLVEPETSTFNKKNSIFNQFLGNIAGGFEVYPEWQLWFGQSISTIAQDAVSLSREEYRAWEQVIWDHKTFKKININSRFRAEQRKSLDFPQWAFRLRERVIFNFPLTQNMSYELSDEILYNLNSVPWIDTTAWDQNRAYIALVQTFSKHYAFAVGYMNQYLFRDAPLAQANNVLYLNFRYNLPT